MCLKTKEKQCLVLTFDLEIWSETKWVQKYISTAQKDTDALLESVMPILDLLKTQNAKATFFTTSLVLEKYPEVIKQIAENGHELASHSTSHIRLSEQNPEVFENELRLQKEKIEKITGEKVYGFRAPHFSLSFETKWLLPVLSRLGFLYDSSIFPIKTPEYGIKNAPKNIYKISEKTLLENNKGSGLSELPQSSVSILGKRIPVAGGIYFRVLPLFLFNFLFRKAVKQGSIPMVYFHPHELCADTPRIKGPRLRTFLKYYGTHKSLKRFEKFICNYNCISIKQKLDLK